MNRWFAVCVIFSSISLFGQSGYLGRSNYFTYQNQVGLNFDTYGQTSYYRSGEASGLAEMIHRTEFHHILNRKQEIGISGSWHKTAMSSYKGVIEEYGVGFLFRSYRPLFLNRRNFKTGRLILPKCNVAPIGNYLQWEVEVKQATAWDALKEIKVLTSYDVFFFGTYGRQIVRYRRLIFSSGIRVGIGVKGLLTDHSAASVSNYSYGIGSYTQLQVFTAGVRRRVFYKNFLGVTMAIGFI